MIRYPTEKEKKLYKKAAGRTAPWCFMFNRVLFGAGGALGPLIFYKYQDRPDVIVHEMVHVHQFYDGWGPLFWIKYLYQWLTKGYRNNPYEMAAYDIQSKVPRKVS